ncbi:MAG: hypothetical protein KIH01_07045 [Candidatus Freyarchaeota archaeon]|nr:hypothetical protein [Candidatus Jordarchaeia archaeon]
MTELRRDYLAERWVIVAKERGMRPSDFKSKGGLHPSSGVCPFCPGNEHMTPPATLLYLERGGRLIVEADRDSERLKDWLVRVAPNLYPALRPEMDPAGRCDGFLVCIGGKGVHEVIIETSNHSAHIHKLDDHHLNLVFKAYAERFMALASLPYVRYVSLFRNYGEAAGASRS